MNRPAPSLATVAHYSPSWLHAQIDKEHVDAVLNHTVGDETCAELSRFEAGFVNVVYFVTCTSGAQFVLRLTNPLKVHYSQPESERVR